MKTVLLFLCIATLYSCKKGHTCTCKEGGNKYVFPMDNNSKALEDSCTNASFTNGGTCTFQ